MRLSTSSGGPGRERLSRRATLLYLALLLAAAFGLRAWFASGWPGPSRVWDERYSFENVASVLETGSLTPVRNFYPSPLYYGPPALVIRLAEPFVDDPRSQLFDPRRERFGPRAYHLARSVQVVYGTASVLLIYWLGLLLFDRPSALLAATILAFLPWHIQVSGVFKPDAQVVFFLLVTLIAGIRWMRAPSTAGALVVGAAVALATSSKLIAGVSGAAFALGAATCAQFGAAAATRRDRWRRYGEIALAGVTSVVLFVAINPHLKIVFAGIEDIKWDYARRAQWAGMTKAQIPLRTLEYLLDPEAFGPLFGALALAAYAALWISGVLAARSRPEAIAGPRLMLAAFPLFYVALHTVQSAWFRDNNFTHILPPFALSLAWLLTGVLRFARGTLRVPPALVGAGAVGLGALLVAPGPLFVYRTYTPSTLDVAYRGLGTEPAEAYGRIVILEPVEAPGVAWRIGMPYSAFGGAELHVESATDLPAEQRRRADVEILLGRVANRESPARVLRRRVLSPALGERRGPEITVLLHPWSRREILGPLEIRPHPGGHLEIPLPDLDGPSWRSIALRVARPPAVTPETRVVARHGRETVPLHRVDPRKTRFDLISERFRARVGKPVTIEGLPPTRVEDLRAFVIVWSPPGERHPEPDAKSAPAQPSSGSADEDATGSDSGPH